MSNILNIDELSTIIEINQQANVWKKIRDQIKEKKSIYEQILKKFKNHKIILTGAGTSQFVGDAIYPYFFNKGLNICSISTTDIVSNPKNYLKKDEKILLISFARSGNSPESVATFNIANKIVDDIFHLVITCNEEGKLAQIAKETSNSELFLLPPEANDKGFAMTSSFTGMTISVMLFLSLIIDQDYFNEVDEIINKFNLNIANIKKFIKNIEISQEDRVIYLGNSEFKGYSTEAHLKFLELTQGLVPSFFDGILAFRHGPKSILNRNSTVIFFMSKNEYARKYEYDLISEIAKDKKIKQLIILDNKNNQEIEKYAKYYLNLNIEQFNEILIGINYILFAQLIAVKTSLKFGIDPDNPSPSGEVNRVVKGVKIYEDFN